ncbi:hypothetical protein AB1286_19675 [Trinickia sp. NRRL B-1857]|uniref:hypothetical protein n=1 Tax=Trinickia sp. NRRL B-1857 TaxID=3162879 RepID=UPI003D2D8A87
MAAKMPRMAKNIANVANPIRNFARIIALPRPERLRLDPERSRSAFAPPSRNAHT